MSKQRLVNTRFWTDPFIQELTPTEKLLFLYFLTNPLTNICGIYEISIRTITNETGISSDVILRAVDKFSKANKIHYINGWIALKNFSKHQSTSENVLKGVEACRRDVPALVLKKIDDMYMVPDGMDNPPVIKSKLNSNLNLNPTGVARAPEEFFNSEEKQKELALALSENKQIPLELVLSEIQEFVAYWTEKNSAGTKQRWQMEKVFEVKRRIGTWFKRVKSFAPKNRGGVSIG